MRLINCSQILWGGSVALLLAGCESMWTSTAGYTPDEDAFRPPSATTTAHNSKSLAAGTAMFETPSNQLYGASPFPPGPVPSDSDSSPADTGDYDNLEIVTPTLKGKLTVMRVGSERNDNNLLSVFAGLRNKSSHSLPLEVETVYKDKADHSLSTGDKSWVSITLKPHEETQYRSVAISEDATDFVVRVRRVSESAGPQ